MRVIRNVSAGDMLIEYGSYMPHHPPHPGLPSLLVILGVVVATPEEVGAGSRASSLPDPLHASW